MRTSLLLGRYECRWPPSWLRSSEKLCRKVSFSTPCDVAASGTNPWAQWQAKQHGFKFVVSKVNSMDSPNMLGTCCFFFPRNRPKDTHEIKDLINSFYIICIKIFGYLSKKIHTQKNHKKQKQKHPRLQEIHQPITFDSWEHNKATATKATTKGRGLGFQQSPTPRHHTPAGSQETRDPSMVKRRATGTYQEKKNIWRQ